MAVDGTVYKVNFKTMTIKTLTSGWHFMRILRLVLAFIIGMQAIEYVDMLAGTLAILLLVQAATNTACCGTSSCSTPIKKNTGNEPIIFEEIN